MKTFSTLAIDDPKELVFGKCKHPITLRNGMVIGGGTVYPELNFTLPGMEIEESTMPEVRRQYTEMIEDACTRAAELQAPGLVVEFELLPPLTQIPEWGAEVTKILRDTLDKTAAAHGTKVALRVTPNDVREFERPPHMRTGEYADAIFKSFELCAKAGADFLAIESTGGKELHDDALLRCDLPLSIFSMGILGCNDMAFLWDRIVEIAGRTSCIPAADSACGFGNTAMVLAERKYIPRLFAAVVRVMSVVRSLVAFERGAIGPNKDCAYEGVFIKAITGYPVALEGAEAACAHLSPIGNIAKAYADLWSNESVQNVKLLGGMAPTVSVEQLVYATRLMNVATAEGSARTLRDWLVKSDAHFDPQAYIFQPEVVISLAREIVKEPTPYLRTKRAAVATLAVLRKASDEKKVEIPENELAWFDGLCAQVDALSNDEGEFIAGMLEQVDTSLVRLEEYGIKQ
jgi:methanol---5-hydroxybenzimidazolylcobamide Co-methyltransferase